MAATTYYIEFPMGDRATTDPDVAEVHSRNGFRVRAVTAGEPGGTER